MSGERILVIDDDEQVASYVRLAFTLNGYQVEWINDGRKAFDKAQQMIPDAIILDLKLPGTNGFRICEQLRSEPRTRAIPIIVVSGSWKNAQDRIRSIEVGADDFLTKPFDAQELIARIKRMLQRKKVDMGVKRFGQKIVGAHFDGADAVLGVFPASADHNNRDGAGAGFGAELFADAETVGAGKFQVENNRVRDHLLRFVESFAAVVDPLDLVAVERECQANIGRDLFVVVNNQYSLSGHSPSFIFFRLCF
jgi:DNA-binding response OmpR family regulator